MSSEFFFFVSDLKESFFTSYIRTFLLTQFNFIVQLLTQSYLYYITCGLYLFLCINLLTSCFSPFLLFEILC
jgi:hypothetical protein